MEFFQDDIYPPCRSNESVLSSNEWYTCSLPLLSSPLRTQHSHTPYDSRRFSGRTSSPKYIDLQPKDMTKLSDAPKIVRKVRKFETIQVEEDAADLKEKVCVVVATHPCHHPFFSLTHLSYPLRW